MEHSSRPPAAGRHGCRDFGSIPRFWYGWYHFGPIRNILVQPFGFRTDLDDFGSNSDFGFWSISSAPQKYKNRDTMAIGQAWPPARRRLPHARYCIQKVRDDSQVNINTATCDTCQAERLLSSVSLPTTVHEFIMSNAGTPSERPSS